MSETPEQKRPGIPFGPTVTHETHTREVLEDGTVVVTPAPVTEKPAPPKE